jgi:hypothetical protein
MRFMREGYRVVMGRNERYCDCGARVLLYAKVTVLSNE